MISKAEEMRHKAEAKALRQVIATVLKCSNVDSSRLAVALGEADAIAERATLSNTPGDAAREIKMIAQQYAGLLAVVLSGNWGEDGFGAHKQGN